MLHPKNAVDLSCFSDWANYLKRLKLEVDTAALWARSAALPPASADRAFRRFLFCTKRGTGLGSSGGGGGGTVLERIPTVELESFRKNYSLLTGVLYVTANFIEINVLSWIAFQYYIFK